MKNFLFPLCTFTILLSHKRHSKYDLKNIQLDEEKNVFNFGFLIRLYLSGHDFSNFERNVHIQVRSNHV